MPVTSTKKPAKRATKSHAAKPFTVEHFKHWAARVKLDTGDPWLLEDFQADFLADVFAGFKECWLVVPEGNTKTTTLAGLALYHCEYFPTAAVPVAASSREQAEVLYRQAEGMVLRTTRLKKVFKCQEGYRRIKQVANGSRIQVFAADDRTGDGIIPTLALLDELHRHRDLRLYRTWRGKLAKRGGQIAAISTAGVPGEEFELTRERIRKSAEEVTKRGRTFTRAASGGVVLHDWSVPEDGDFEDLELVKAANPFSGVTLEMLREKRESSTMTLSHWRRFTCNLPTRSDDAAITEAEWYAAEIGEDIPQGESKWVGLDVGWKWDTTSMVPLWWRDPEYRLLGRATILEPPRDGSSLHPDAIKGALLAEQKRGPIHTLVMDMSRAEDIAAWVEDEIGCIVIDRGQSNQFAVMDYERFMEALRQGWLKHTGDPGLREHALNAIAKVLPYGDTRFDRPKDSRKVGHEAARRRVIDALSAAAMVHSVAVGEFTEPTIQQEILVQYA